MSQNTGFAWDHGDYAAEIDTNYLGFAGPGVKHLGLDGSAAEPGPDLGRAEQRPDHVPTSTPRAPGSTRPTSGRPLMYLTGLQDDYEHDGRVITAVLANPNRALSGPG